MTSLKNLLVELLVEELPPKALRTLGAAFADLLADSLKAQGLASAQAQVAAFATPRRLAVHVSGVAPRSTDKIIAHKLMPVSVGLTAEGDATPALLKKLATLGADRAVIPHLQRKPDGKAESLYLNTAVQGATLAEGLQQALDEMLARLPIPKVMQYQLADGWTSVKFVRPAHRLVALHGADIVPVAMLGLHAGRSTQGHRFEASTPVIEIEDADSYVEQLRTQGAVIASFEERLTDIVKALRSHARQIRCRLEIEPRNQGDADAEIFIAEDSLIQEVTALVERPNVLVCQFDPEFLEVPQECLILTMKANQKYFPLLDSAGKLTNTFLVVSNIRPADPAQVITGNERVIRPRLADAKFFFDQDRKTRLADRVERLSKVVYHNKLGSQLERTQRISKLAGMIGERLHADASQAQRAALLCKADLLTDMVGEFPELQGIMGRYYALHDGEAPEVADAIQEHYLPRFSGDALPEHPVSQAVALAEKLDTLIGIYGIGVVPTGDKDPYGLRRQALGVLRILSECDLSLDLFELLKLAKAGFAPGVVADTVDVDLQGFMLERLRGYLREHGYAVDEIEAVVGLNPARIDQVVPRIKAVEAFRALPEAEALAGANKRIRNILKKTTPTKAHPEPLLFQAPAEKDLFAVTSELLPAVRALVNRESYSEALCMLAGARKSVDTFFDEVMVMTEDTRIRDNRLALLTQVDALLNEVADISRLATSAP